VSRLARGRVRAGSIVCLGGYLVQAHYLLKYWIQLLASALLNRSTQEVLEFLKPDV
jgi:hypothetical protein